MPGEHPQHISKEPRSNALKRDTYAHGVLLTPYMVREAPLMCTRRAGCPDAPKILRLAAGVAFFRAWAVLVAPKIGSRKAGKPKTADPGKNLPVRKRKKKTAVRRKSNFENQAESGKTNQAQNINENGTGSARKQTAARRKKSIQKR